MRTLKSILAAALVIGTASMALADDGTDTRLDTSRTGSVAVQSQQFNTRNVALPYGQYRVAPQAQSAQPDIAGASHDNL
jgi:hypothetical protein